MAVEHGDGLGARRRPGAQVLPVSLIVMMVGATAQAAFVPPTLWTRGQADTTYQEWDRFTTAGGANSPDVGVYNPNGMPGLSDGSGVGLVTGSGNLYSFSGPLDIDVAVPEYASPGKVTTVILQTRTIGTEIDLATLNIGGLTPVDRGELLREELGGPGGEAVETWFKFHVPASTASFAIEFKASGHSMSLDRVAVDTITAADFIPEPNPVSEPATAALLLGAGMVSIRSRRMARSR